MLAVTIKLFYIGNVKRNVTCDVAHHVTPYLLTLANRNDPISVAMPKVAKVSTIMAFACHCRQHYLLKYSNNVNYP